MIGTEKVDADVHRLMRDGACVALAMRLMNGRWGLFDKDGCRLTLLTFDDPKKVAEGCAPFLAGTERINI